MWQPGAQVPPEPVLAPVPVLVPVAPVPVLVPVPPLSHVMSDSAWPILMSMPRGLVM